MALIKKRDAGSITREAVVLDLSDLQRQAEQILDEARRRAAEIVEEARVEADQIRDGADVKGFQEGHPRGLKEGRDEGRRLGLSEAKAEHAQTLQALEGEWSGALQQFEQQRDGMIIGAREDVLAFAFETARKIIHRAIDVDPSIVNDQIDAALDLLVSASRLALHVHPDDVELVEQHLPEIARRFGESTHAEIVADPDIGRGGCHLSTACGYIDARIHAQLDRLAAVLMPGRRLSSSDPTQQPEGTDDTPAASDDQGDAT